MPSFKPCCACERLRDERISYDWFSYCADCTNRRANYLATILMDRSFRAHLARQILGMPCHRQSNCPEEPHGHASFNEVMDRTTLEQYKDIVKLALDQFERPCREDSITAFELLAAHKLIPAIEYCPQCLAAAQQNFPQRNDMVQLCEACLAGRNTHVFTVHRNQTAFLDVWEEFNVKHCYRHPQRCEIEYGYEDLEFDNFVELYILYRAGGGYTEIFGAFSVACLVLFGVNQAILGWHQKIHNDRTHESTTQHNDRTYREIVQHNARTHREIVRNNEQTHWETVRNNEQTYWETIQNNKETFSLALRQFCYQIWRDRQQTTAGHWNNEAGRAEEGRAGGGAPPRAKLQAARKWASVDGGPLEKPGAR